MKLHDKAVEANIAQLPVRHVAGDTHATYDADQPIGAQGRGPEVVHPCACSVLHELVQSQVKWRRRVKGVRRSEITIAFVNVHVAAIVIGWIGHDPDACSGKVRAS